MLDVNLFVGEFKKARSKKEEGLLEEAFQGYRKAVEIYQGDYMEEYRYDDWLVSERVRLRELWLQACQEASELLEARQEFDEASSVLKEAIRREPYQEELYRRLIKNLLKAGRRDEAITQYRACREILQSEFGIEPAVETSSLLEEN